MNRPFLCLVNSKMQVLVHPDPTIQSHRLICEHFKLTPKQQDDHLFVVASPQSGGYNSNPSVFRLNFDHKSGSEKYARPLPKWYSGTSKAVSVENAVRSAIGVWQNVAFRKWKNGLCFCVVEIHANKGWTRTIFDEKNGEPIYGEYVFPNGAWSASLYSLKGTNIQPELAGVTCQGSDSGVVSPATATGIVQTWMTALNLPSEFLEG